MTSARLAMAAALPGQAIAPADPAHDGPTVSVVLSATGPTEGTAARIESATDYRNLELVVTDGTAGASLTERVNEGARKAQGELLLLLDADLEPLRPDWLTRLVELLTQERVAAAGPLVLRPQRTGHPFEDVGLVVESAGMAFDIAGGRVRARGIGAGRSPYSAWCRGHHDVAALAGSCLLTRTSDFESLGGLDTRYSTGPEAWDLSLRLAERGRLVLDAGAALARRADVSGAEATGDEARRARRGDNTTFNGVWGGRLRRRILREHLGSTGLHTGPADSTYRTGTTGSALLQEVAEGLERLGWVRAEDDEPPVLELVEAAPGAGQFKRPAALSVALTETAECVPAPRVSVVVGVNGCVPAATDRPVLSVPAQEGGRIEVDAVIDALREYAARPRFAVRTCAPDRKAAAHWEDATLGTALIGALGRAGMSADLHPADLWEAPRAHPYDVVIHLRGSRRYEPRSGARNVLWLFSHADDVGGDELDGYDLVVAASDALAETVRGRTSTRVEVDSLDPDPDAGVRALLGYLDPA